MKKICLTSGRYQPLHKTHQKVFERMFKLYDEVVISIMHNSKPTRENPFYSWEVERVLKNVSPKLKIVFHHRSLFLAFIDFLKLRRKIRHYYTRNRCWKYLAKLLLFDVIYEKRDGISGSYVRELIYQNNPEWKQYVHPRVAEMMETEEIKGRLKRLSTKNKYLSKLNKFHII